MTGITGEHILMAINMILVGLVAFFMRQLVVRFERMEVAINALNKQLAIVVTKQENHQDRFHRQDAFETRIDTEIKDIRNRLHSLSNDINKAYLRLEMVNEHCPARKND